MMAPQGPRPGSHKTVIGRAGIGIDNIDVPVATSRGIIVMNTPFGCEPNFEVKWQ
jgi:phosphoglycerate dehydrogenase-like enzyme